MFISFEGRHVAPGRLPGSKAKFYWFKLVKAAHAALALADKLLELVCIGGSLVVYSFLPDVIFYLSKEQECLVMGSFCTKLRNGSSSN